MNPPDPQPTFTIEGLTKADMVFFLVLFDKIGFAVHRNDPEAVRSLIEQAREDYPVQAAELERELDSWLARAATLSGRWN